MKIPISQIFFVGFSIALSFLLWLWVGAQERSEIVVNVPLEYRNLPRGVEILPGKDFISTVNIWVKGTATSIKNLRPSDISAWVDLSSTRSGLRNFELGPDEVKVPYGFSVLRINPSRISLRIEEVVTRNVPVTPRFEGEPPLGFRLGEMNVTPAEVQIRGPQSAVASVRQAFTDSIDISQIRGIHSETVNVGLDNSAVRIVSAKTVEIHLHIAEIEDVFTMRLPVSINDNVREIRFNPKMVRIDLLGSKTALKELKTEQIQVLLDVAGLQRGTYELTPRVIFGPELQKKISVKDIVPDRIHTRIL